ncbi:hypothetical protein VFPPC_16931 [Pochonia chlamydosporia 170]|uniref:Uncharacterized protein n=1 Tax=Pochonia chlamydosporia 170 TaxID=1380566 RepID=A0A179F089_METCM|nr:hypothetical protein VFPPC_16931 [Pochonia chlamydosporia 170]OAQ58841.1 hypothetical protein VFPPC_16931 [Pochonia chlamydosporia 170]
MIYRDRGLRRHGVRRAEHQRWIYGTDPAQGAVVSKTLSIKEQSCPARKHVWYKYSELPWKASDFSVGRLRAPLYTKESRVSEPACIAVKSISCRLDISLDPCFTL